MVYEQCVCMYVDYAWTFDHLLAVIIRVIESALFFYSFDFVFISLSKQKRIICGRKQARTDGFQKCLWFEQKEFM